ncbi:hypothetical protein PUN28_008660 [Cardiocondyla obscurior]|uniref:Uncharacterized protein n=1 Tax=Cardiocondyla obscurior TaxID=286306 RepID=A0AAW2G1H2_9HYME
MPSGKKKRKSQVINYACSFSFFFFFLICSNVPTFDSLLRTLHKDGSRARVERRIGVPVLGLALADMLQIVNANSTLRQVLLEVVYRALGPDLLASGLRAGVDATAILVPHVPM